MSNRRAATILCASAAAAAAGCKTGGAAAPAGAPPAAPPAAVARAAAAPAALPAALAPLPPVALQPAEAARARLAFTVAVDSPFKIAADLDALMRKLGIETPVGQPFIDQLVSGEGIEGVPLTRPQLERLDP